MASHRNEYDLMKDMIGKIRLGQELAKKKINEEENRSVRRLQPQEEEDEKKKFLEAVGGSVEFNPFAIYDDTVEFSGSFTAERILWNFSLDSSKGCYISCDSTQLSDETVQKLQKLKAYYDQWSQYWANETSVNT
jgi:hypothetical protein